MQKKIIIDSELLQISAVVLTDVDKQQVQKVD